MKNQSYSILIITIMMLSSCSSKIIINTESDAKIYVDGQFVTNGTHIIKIKKNQTTYVKAEKTGYIPAERKYTKNKKNKLPKSDFLEMITDEAYESSLSTDIANQDVEINTNRKENEAWKLMSQIITNHFDIIEVTDLNTGYMRTSWVQKNFNSATVRTRLIIKLGQSDPLTYKVKILSEIAPSGTSVKMDEKFREWDRVLRKYEPIIGELQSRLQ